MLLYCKITDTTGIKLAEDMGIPSINGYQHRLREHYPFIIRWGVGCGIGYVPQVVVNKMNAVNNAVNKYKAITLFNEGGVRTAPFTDQVPVVGRTREHTQGQNFWLCWEQSQVDGARRDGAEYFIKYIPVKQEFRVHVLGGEVGFVQRKYQRNRSTSAFMGIQGFTDSWHREIYEGRDVTQDLKDTAVKAVEALGLDFGGVDLIVSLDDGLSYVCEVNTGPALPHPRVRAPYIAYFRKRMEELV